MSLDGFARAAALDPGWSMPGDKMADTKHFLQAMTHSVSSKVRYMFVCVRAHTHTHTHTHTCTHTHANTG